MSGDLIEDTPLGPRYVVLTSLAAPVTKLLLDAGVDPLRAGFLAYEAVDRVLLGLRRCPVSVEDLVSWGDSDG